MGLESLHLWLADFSELLATQNVNSYFCGLLRSHPFADTSFCFGIELELQIYVIYFLVLIAIYQRNFCQSHLHQRFSTPIGFPIFSSTPPPTHFWKRTSEYLSASNDSYECFWYFSGLEIWLSWVLKPLSTQPMRTFQTGTRWVRGFWRKLGWNWRKSYGTRSKVPVVNVKIQWSPLMWPPLLPGWRGHMEWVVSHWGIFRLKDETYVPDCGSLIGGGIAWQGVTQQRTTVLQLL